MINLNHKNFPISALWGYKVSKFIPQQFINDLGLIQPYVPWLLSHNWEMISCAVEVKLQVFTGKAGKKLKQTDQV